MPENEKPENEKPDNTNPWESEEWLDYADRFLAHTFPKIEDSSVFMALIPQGAGDLKFWLELGAGIMMDKPIMVVVPAGRPLPAKLTNIADAIIEMPPDFDTNAAARDRVGERITGAMDRVLARKARRDRKN